jgi:hypothetical protein
MTGAYVRIKRDNRWQNIEFDQLTDDEMENFADEHESDGWKWAMFFAKFIRDNVSEEERGDAD